MEQEDGGYTGARAGAPILAGGGRGECPPCMGTPPIKTHRLRQDATTPAQARIARFTPEATSRKTSAPMASASRGSVARSAVPRVHTSNACWVTFHTVRWARRHAGFAAWPRVREPCHSSKTHPVGPRDRSNDEQRVVPHVDGVNLHPTLPAAHNIHHAQAQWGPGTSCGYVHCRVR